jgi:organic radical activating enzyme
MIKFFLTNNCNYKCNFCNIHNKKEKNFSSLEELTNAINFINNLMDKNLFSNNEFEIFGGEPTLHPELINFINLLDNRFEIILFTNLHKDIDYFLKIKKNIEIISTFYINKVNYIDFFNKVKEITNNNISIKIILTIYHDLYNDINLVKNIINYIEKLELIKRITVDFNSYFISEIDNKIKELLINYFNFTIKELNKNITKENFIECMNIKNFYCKGLIKSKYDFVINEKGLIYKCFEFHESYFLNIFKYKNLEKLVNKFLILSEKNIICKNICCYKMEKYDYFINKNQLEKII